MSKKSQHVVKDGDGWAVKKGGEQEKRLNILIPRKKLSNMVEKLLRTRKLSFTSTEKMEKSERKIVMGMIHVRPKTRRKYE